MQRIESVCVCTVHQQAMMVGGREGEDFYVKLCEYLHSCLPQHLSYPPVIFSLPSTGHTSSQALTTKLPFNFRVTFSIFLRVRPFFVVPRSP